MIICMMGLEYHWGAPLVALRTQDLHWVLIGYFHHYFRFPSFFRGTIWSYSLHLFMFLVPLCYKRPVIMTLTTWNWIGVVDSSYSIRLQGSIRDIISRVCVVHVWTVHHVHLLHFTGLQLNRVYTSLGSSCPTCVHQSWEECQQSL